MHYNCMKIEYIIIHLTDNLEDYINKMNIHNIVFNTNILRGMYFEYISIVYAYVFYKVL